MDLRIADHAASADLVAARLELRLDEDERFPTRLREPERRRERDADADERDVAGDEVRRERELGQLAGVRALEHGHARVGAQPLVELAAADVERDHTRRAPLEEDVREAAGRGADVERVAPGRVDSEFLEGVRELVAAARDEPWRLLDDELRGLIDLLAGLLVTVDEARHDERLRLRAALGKATLDQEDVQTLAHAVRLACGCAAF